MLIRSYKLCSANSSSPSEMALVLVAVLVAVLAALVPYYLLFAWRRDRLGNKPIPGPRPLPLLGNVLAIGIEAPDMLKNLFRLWHEYGMIYRVWLGSALFVIVNDAEYAERFLISTTNISKSMNYKFLQPWLGTGLLTSTGKKWKHHRKILNPAFHYKILEGFMDMINKNGNIMIQKLKKEVGGSEFNIDEYTTLCTLDIIYEAAMGVPMNVQDQRNLEYVLAIKGLGEIVTKRSIRPWLFPDFLFNLSDLGNRQRKYVKVLHDTSYKVIENRKRIFLQNEDGDKERFNEYGQRKRLAFLDLLLQYNKDGGDLSEEEIREEVDTFMFEGHDSISSELSFCMWLLANNPDCQETAYEELIQIFRDSDRDPTVFDLQEMKYLECVIKETLRMFPSVALFLRELDEDVNLDEYHIMAGTHVVISPYLMHRNPKYFPEPEKFDPERFLAANSQGRHPYAFIPFSAGPRNCIGQRFAMMEMKSIVSNVLRNYKLYPSSKKLALSFELILVSHGGVHVKLENRKKMEM